MKYHPLVKQAIEKIDFYKDNIIPLSFLSPIIDVKTTTLSAKIRRKEIPAKYDGYRWGLTKRISKNLVIKNKSAVIGWTRLSDIVKSNGISQQSLNYICRRDRLKTEIDIMGRRRLSPPAEENINKIKKQYSSSDVAYIGDKKYYSLRKTSRDAAANLTKRGTKDFRRQAERIYKTYYSWFYRFDSVVLDGHTKLFISDSDYRELTDMLRISDAAKYANVSRRTINNWRKRGIVRDKKTPSGKTSVLSRKEFRESLIGMLETERTKNLLHQLRTKEKPYDEVVNFLDCVFDVNSKYWQKLIGVMRVVEKSYRHLKKPEFSMEEYITEKTGWSKSRIEATREIARKRDKWHISLDGPIKHGSQHSFIRLFTSTKAIDPLELTHDVILSEDVRDALDDALSLEEIEMVDLKIGREQPPMSLEELAFELNQKPELLEGIFYDIFRKLAPDLEKYYDPEDY